jgi:hypothetical protein
MTQRLTDMASYKGTLPYDSELFGVYQPLLGWRSVRQKRRHHKSARKRKAAVVATIIKSLHPKFDIQFGRPEEPLRISGLSPGEPAKGIFNSPVLAAIKERLPPEGGYDDSIWRDALSPDSLNKVLTERVPSRANELFRQADASKNPVLARRVRRENPQELVRQFVAKESQVAGLLYSLHLEKQFSTLKELFYAGDKLPHNIFQALNFQDPFDTIDPTKELERVGLSPIGIAHLFREYFFELDTFLGPPVGHVWVSPGSTVEMAEVHTRRIYQEQSIERSIQTVRRSEDSNTTQDDISNAVKDDNRTGTKFGVSVTANENWGWGNATETGSFNLDTSQETAREQVHKSMRQQSKKLTNEITENYKSTFRTITETTDTSSKRYVLTNSTGELINYELRRKMRQVVVQVQDIGSYLCWQTYVDDPGRQLGLARLVHLGVPPDLSKIPPPQLVVPPSQFSDTLSITIPFQNADNASNDDDFDNGSETSLGIGDKTNHIVADFPQGPVRCSQPGFRLIGVTIDTQGVDATMSVAPSSIVDDGSGGFSFTVHLDHINFKEKDAVVVKATLSWYPVVNEAAVQAENDKRLAMFTAQEQALFNQAFVTTARDRINAASNVAERPFDDLREEERIVVYRSLIQEMLTPSSLVPQPDNQTQHVVAELLNSIFDVDKMLYFVAPEWWRPRLHQAHQQLGGLPSATDPVTGGTISVTPQIPSDSTVDWGEADTRIDSYYITEDSKTAKFGSSLGWLMQLDGDDLRNAFLNAPWVKAVLPIRPGKELAALSWLKHVEGKEPIGPSDIYLPPAVRVRRYLDRVQGRPGHHVQADPGTAQRLRLPDDIAECGGRTDPPEGHAGDLDHRRGARRVDARTVG